MVLSLPRRVIMRERDGFVNEVITFLFYSL